MSLFIFKPHVVGSQSKITTPDVLIDHVHVDGKVRSVSALTAETYLQAEEGETARPAYVVTAVGGGTLIGPATVLDGGRICLARQAWRLDNLAAHIGDVTVNGRALSSLTLPVDMIAAVGGTLPRGVQLIVTLDEEGGETVMEDAVMGRRLEHRAVLSDPLQDRWQGKRPEPRYSIGPTTKDVPHYL